MSLTITVFRNIDHMQAWCNHPATAVDPDTGELYSTALDDSNLPPKELPIAHSSWIGNLDRVVHARHEIEQSHIISHNSILLNTVLESAFNSGTIISTIITQKLYYEIQSLLEAQYSFSEETRKLLEDLHSLCEASFF